MNFHVLEQNFNKNIFENEDDIKIHFHSDIAKPILKSINPEFEKLYKSENHLKFGGRTDATFQNVFFEFKSYDKFSKKSGIDEALFGRNDNDRGLYSYLISGADLDENDTKEKIESKIRKCIGIGFDGKNFIFARFIPSPTKNKLNCEKISIKINEELNLCFSYEIKNFNMGLRRLTLIFKQNSKMELNKNNVLSVINTKSDYVRNAIIKTYEEINYNINDLNGSNRVRTLYKEWDRVFGIMYGTDEQATDFTEVSSKIRELYGISNEQEIDSKMYLFALQTFFNIFLKLLVYSFLSQLVDPSFTVKQYLSKAEIDSLFDGTGIGSNKLVNNFFEAHFMEWFTYTDSGFEEEIVNNTLEKIDGFDLTTFVLKPEDVQDILQEVYMELIPKEMRHLMGEYFSPDWIVEHVIDISGYDGDINKTLIDPCAGDGPFLTQAIKRIVLRQNGVLTREDIDKITHNIVGFDINPISVVAAKTNYILIMFSAYFDNCDQEFGDPVNIPVFIADSILSPVVYTEENGDTLKLTTSVGELELPKFDSFDKGNEFLMDLSHAIHEKPNYEVFKALTIDGKKLVSNKYEPLIHKLFDKLYILHRAGKDSFWPIILRNSFAPIMISNKFDFVVGNPPWIAWKSMSKSYREGTLAIWQSYGIFEKNAYDKKTTHDDFGMAVTYVSIDQYLKNEGTMVFLLPASFLKSTKGGEGFRKFEIIRKNQNIPFCVEEVDDFSDVKLFTIPTVAIKFKKNTKMVYPMNNYVFYHQIGRKSVIDSHNNWNSVSKILTTEIKMAQPISKIELQSAWLTLDNMMFANNVTDPSKERVYKGRKGIEPAGAKGIYILETPTRNSKGYLHIKNDMTRQRRLDVLEMGAFEGNIEEDYVYPMLGGRNISKWHVKSNEFMLVPHDIDNKYGIPEVELAKKAPYTYKWLEHYHDVLLDTRIQNGKFFNKDTQPFYRLDNVGEYTYAPYKVLWKEQTGSMSAVVVGSYYESIPNPDKSLFSKDKPIVVDSKVLMLALYDKNEAYYVCGIINSPNVIEVVDGYAINTNRGIDVLKNVAVPKYDNKDALHNKIANISYEIHELAKKQMDITSKEKELNQLVYELFTR